MVQIAAEIVGIAGSYVENRQQKYGPLFSKDRAKLYLLLVLYEGHRYLVKGNYKIIYKEIQEGLLITDVFDSRQDPIKINNKKENQ
jgi:hypothetical protein